MSRRVFTSLDTGQVYVASLGRGRSLMETQPYPPPHGSSDFGASADAKRVDHLPTYVAVVGPGLRLPGLPGRRGQLGQRYDAPAAGAVINTSMRCHYVEHL